MAATIEVLAEVGFDEVSVEVIAERAGCSRPAFYQYFASKHDVFWALASTLGEEIVGLAGRLGPVGRDAAGVDRLAGWISAFMELHAAWAPVFVSFQAASRDHLREARRSTTVSLRTDAALLRAFGRSKSRFAERLMGALVAVLDRSGSYLEQAGPSVDAGPFVVALAEVFHRSVFGPIESVNLHRGRTLRRPRVRVSLFERRALPELPPRQEQVRQKLLDAGVQVLPARGYHDSRVDDIAGAAGLSHGTFYRYFLGKDHYFQVLAEGAAGRALDVLDRLDLQAPPAELRAWVTDWMHTCRADGGIISTWQEVRTNGELARLSGEVAAAMFVRLVALLERRDFGDPEADATSMLAVLEAIPNNVYTLGFTGEDDGIEILLTILQRGYRGSGA